MKKRNSTTEHKTPNNHTPEPEDMELEDYDDSEYPRKGIYKFFNIHVIFLCLVLIFVGFIFFRIKNWGVEVDLNEIFADGPGTYDDSLDSVLPLLDTDRNIINHDEPATIVAFGNAPFADDRDSENNLCNLIAEATGATVYNCSVSDSYLACSFSDMDRYTFYWLMHLVCGSDVDHNYIEAPEVLGENLPIDAQEAYETIKSIDFNEVDVITVMYDATDYLQGHWMYDDQNSTDTFYFTGNLEAGIELLQATYPHIRIIVMSPTYAYAVDEKGNYVSSDQYTYNDQDVLSTYVIKEYASCSARSVSFIDNLYNTITEDNADQYLTDNLHLNVEGRKLIAERFEYFFNYYKKGYADIN